MFLYKGLKHIFKLSLPYWKSLLFAFSLSLLSAAASLAFPIGIQKLIDTVLKNNNQHLLNILTIGLIGLFACQFVFRFISSYLLKVIGEKITTKLRNTLYKHLHKLGVQYFYYKKTGSITSRLTSDVKVIQNTITNSVSNLLITSLSLIGSSALLLYINWHLAAIIFIAIPLTVFLSNYYGKKYYLSQKSSRSTF